MKIENKRFMMRAIDLAAKALDKTYPNPMVGAVIVKNGKIVGEGYHKKAGTAHAEINALKTAAKRAKGASMFVSLEPCAHYGKTPPCVDSIIKSGIRKVYTSFKDPNPITSGKGIKALKNAGIDVHIGLANRESQELNRKYIKYITKGLPYVTVKLAESVDGKIAARDGSSKWITCEASRGYARKMRAQFDAIMVGSNTIINDDPVLLPSVNAKNGKGFARIVVDSSLRMPLKSKILKTTNKSRVILAVTSNVSRKKILEFKKIKGVEILLVRADNGMVSLKDLLGKLADLDIVNILVEGGGTLAGSLADKSLADEWIFFISPKIMGGPYSSVKNKGVSNIKKSINLKNVKVEKSGDDIIIRGLACSRA